MLYRYSIFDPSDLSVQLRLFFPSQIPFKMLIRIKCSNHISTDQTQISLRCKGESLSFTLHYIYTIHITHAQITSAEDQLPKISMFKINKCTTFGRRLLCIWSVDVLHVYSIQLKTLCISTLLQLVDFKYRCSVNLNNNNSSNVLVMYLLVLHSPQQLIWRLNLSTTTNDVLCTFFVRNAQQQYSITRNIDSFTYLHTKN